MSDRDTGSLSESLSQEVLARLKKTSVENLMKALDMAEKAKKPLAVKAIKDELASRKKTSFKESLLVEAVLLEAVILEARRADLSYNEKVVKNKIDRVAVELEGNDSASMTRLASRFDRLDKAIKRMGEKRGELNEQLKDKVTDLFDAEDVVLTRVVETASFVMTLSKLVKAAEQEPKKIVNYEKIAEELAKLIPAELQEKVEEIQKLYTEISLAQDKSPGLRVKNKVDESLNEGIVDFFKKITAKAIKAAKSLASWALSYDKKLAGLKKQAAVPVTEGAISEAAKGFKPETWLKKDLWVNPKDLDKVFKEGHPDGRNAGDFTKDEKLKMLHEEASYMLRKLHEAGKLKLPLTYKGDPSYAYTITKLSPLTVESSDGGNLKLKYLSDLGTYAENFWEDLFGTMSFEWASEHFHNKAVNQEQHELNRMRGD